MSHEMIGTKATTWRPNFEPRSYPALGVCIAALYLTAVLALVTGIATAIGVAGVEDLPARYFFAAASLAAFIVPAVLCAAAAESIRVWIDVQANTQEAAFYAKLSHLGREAGR